MAQNRQNRYPTPTIEEEFGVEWAIAMGWDLLGVNTIPHDNEFEAALSEKHHLKFMRLRRDIGDGDGPEILEEMLVVGCREARVDKVPTRFTRAEGLPANFKALAVFCRHEEGKPPSQWKPKFYIPIWHDTDVFYPEHKYRVVFVPKERFTEFGLDGDRPIFDFAGNLNYFSLGGTANN